MAKKNYIDIDKGTGNIIMKDISGENIITINNSEPLDYSKIEQLIENAGSDYLGKLKEQFEGMKGLLEERNNSFVEYLGKAIKNPRVEIKNLNAGQMGDYSQTGDRHIFQWSKIYDLQARISERLKLPNLDENIRTKLEILSGKVIEENKPIYEKELLPEFNKIVKEQLSIYDESKEKLIIWLNREIQRHKFHNGILRCKSTTPFIFCIAGDFSDKTNYAGRQLKEHFTHKILKLENPDNQIEKEIEMPFYLYAVQDAQNAYFDMLREILNVGFMGAAEEELPELLKQEHNDRHILVSCKVSEWKKEGLEKFIEFCRSIKRPELKLMVIIMEFENQNYDELVTFFSTQNDNTVVLLPKLEKVKDIEISNFYNMQVIGENKRYSDYFYEGTLTPADAPIYFADAINKLKLK